MLFSTEKYIFFNPEIPGFGLCQSRDSGSRDCNPYSHYGEDSSTCVVGSRLSVSKLCRAMHYNAAQRYITSPTTDYK